MPAIHYLAYGSNLHPHRLATRVPSARALGVVEMPGFLLAFHKRSIDGSGKCLLYTDQGLLHKAYGVLYEFDAHDKAGLDALEGNGKGYSQQDIQLRLNGETFATYLYVARSSYIEPSLVPYHWYKTLVLAGARYHNFPEDYISHIEATPSRSDPDANRTRENEELLRQMAHW